MEGGGGGGGNAQFAPFASCVLCSKEQNNFREIHNSLELQA